jgi:two-component system LytT family sensor kinase
MNNNSNNIQWRKIILHIAAWAIVFSLPYLMRYDAGSRPKDLDDSGFLLLHIFTSLLWVPVYYFNAVVLTPKLIYQRKYIAYAAAVLGLFAIVMFIHGSIFTNLIHSRPFKILNSVLFNLIPFLAVLAIGTASRQAQDKVRSDKLLQQRQEENLKTELSFLRSQISPHFMFNVLNNMLAMARLKSDQLEPTIIKLSSLMRYILYETDEETVSLKKETEYLQSYIDLQRQRIGNKVQLKVRLEPGEDPYTLAPMLLIPFIENAFKHGMSAIDEPMIDIELYTSANMLYFRVANKFNPGAAAEVKDKTSGIGLQNVKRRLNLLYDNRYSLLINDIDNWFTVSLQLNLQQS